MNESNHAISSEDFDARSLPSKIQWLQRSAPPYANGDYSAPNIIHVGPRRMTRRQALCMALDYAIEADKKKVPEICRQLVTENPERDLIFIVQGISFSRNRLCEWAREGIALKDQPLKKPEITDMGKQLYASNSQNVHNDSVKIAMADQLITIRDRIPESKRLTNAVAQKEIETYLNTQRNSAAALEGLKTVIGRPNDIENFIEGVAGSLTVLWNYIRAVEDPTMRRDLQTSMRTKLSEICHEHPCAIGMIERIIDIPTAIDWSITQRISVEHLRNELQTMAGAVNESCDTDESILALSQWARADAKDSASRAALEEQMNTFTTELKRDCFLHTARIELGLLRGIDQNLVRAEANKIFPENLVL